jgi:hypothetical protein
MIQLKLGKFGLSIKSLNISEVKKMASIKKIKEEKEKDGYKKVEDTIFKFEDEGDTIEGMLVGKEQSRNFSNMVYKILVESGETMTIFGTIILDQKMRAIKENDIVKIVFTGTQENKKKGLNAIKLFDVFVKQHEN